ncbi:MAG: hypothetical protein CL610_13610 [Anaerolineaceae bacterium]|nr:hypothetical protein [Anaerolineaceae bacterium]
MRRTFTMIALLLILAACEGGGDDNNGDPFASNSIIQWDRSPQTVVFRTEVAGGDDADSFLIKNEIPLCSIYGDNRVVWTNDLGDFDVQVLWDKVTDQQIQDFITYLTVSQQVFNYDAGADLQPPGPIQPVREVITVNVNGRIHQTDSMAANPWPLDYFAKIVDFCKQVSRAPVLYEPTGAWLSVQAIEYDSMRPLQVWDGESAGLDLAEVAGRTEPLWLTGNNLRILWNILRTSSPRLMFSDLDGNAFEVVLEVPGIHPNSPPAPES